jgi:hypothetical protein
MDMASPIVCECAHVLDLVWQLFGFNHIHYKCSMICVTIALNHWTWMHFTFNLDMIGLYVDGIDWNWVLEFGNDW